MKQKLSKKAKDMCDEEDSDKLYKFIMNLQFLDDEQINSIDLSILKNASYDSLRNTIVLFFASNRKRIATEIISKKILYTENIYTTRNDEKSEMWIYNEGVYVPNGKTYIKEICRKLLKSLFTSHISNEVILKVESDTYIDSEEFFSNNVVDEVVLKNGVLNIFTKELRPFSPHPIFFNKLPIEYIKDEKCPLILKHFETVTKSEADIKIFQELFGYVLLKEYKYEKAVMMTGSGRNGKGKTFELFKRFLGVENCVNVPIQELERDMFKMGDLMNKMVNLAGDIGDATIKDSSWFKSLTGRDLVTASRKFKNSVSFVNYAKMFFNANNLPNTYDDSPAFWKRWIFLEFVYTFVTKEEFESATDEERKYLKIMDPEIVDKMTTDKELSGLLNWALEGLERLTKNKDFTKSLSSEEIKTAWLRKSSSIKMFIADCIEIVSDDEKRMVKQEFYEHYKKYCSHFKVKRHGEKSIKYALESEGVSDERISIDGVQKAYWCNIKLNDYYYENIEGNTKSETEKIKKEVFKYLSKSEDGVSFIDMIEHLKIKFDEIDINNTLANMIDIGEIFENPARTIRKV